MAHAELRARTGMVHIRWTDGVECDFPYIWLRDNDPAGFHPETQERMTDLTAIPLDIAPSGVEVERSTLCINWPDQDSATSFDLDWLRAHRPGIRAADPAELEFTLWRSALGAESVPRENAAVLMESDADLRDWITATRSYGLSIVEGLADTADAGMDVARRIGFLRETNFGRTFEVKSKPNPNNLAYTTVALPLHTDLANQELPPGFQFLHCLRNEAQGGGSLFCDGYAVAADLEGRDPEAFKILSTVSIPFRFHDTETDIRSRKKVITLNEFGDVSEICFNAHLADVLDIAPDKMAAYYRAYRSFMEMTRDDAYLVTLKLKAGEMAVFDNRRVLHGREAFDPNTGYRHLHGCYVDRGEFEGRLRTLPR